MLRHRRLWTVRITAAVAALSAAACHAGDEKIDACKLLSAAQAGKLLGTTVSVHRVDTAAAGPGAASMCNYNNGHPGAGFMLLAGRVHYKDATEEVARQEQEASDNIPPGIEKPAFVEIKGLGEAAYLSKTSAYFQLHVLAHGSVIVINRNTAASDEAVSQARRIANAALKTLARKQE